MIEVPFSDRKQVGQLQKRLTALREAAHDYLDCTAEPMYVHMLRGKDCDGGCRLALQNALSGLGETHRTTEGK